MFFVAIILGLVEGITEFLPVSSTGHLILAGHFLHFEDKVFDIAIQMGAILAVMWLFRERLWETLRYAAPARQVSIKAKRAHRLILNLLLAFLPAAVIGLLLHKAIKEYLFNSFVVAMALIIGGLLILVIERIKPPARTESMDAITPKTALLIGLMQCLAMIPGVSRSGATILGALMLGVERKAAAEFSFFLAIPTLCAASFFDLISHRHELTSDNMLLIMVGFVAAFISALVVVKAFMAFIERHGFAPFAWYRIALGLIILIVLR